MVNNTNYPAGLGDKLGVPVMWRVPARLYLRPGGAHRQPALGNLQHQGIRGQEQGRRQGGGRR